MVSFVRPGRVLEDFTMSEPCKRCPVCGFNEGRICLRECHPHLSDVVMELRRKIAELEENAEFSCGCPSHKDQTGHVTINPKTKDSEIMHLRLALDNRLASARMAADAMREFIRKVESGEARSKRSYAQFKEVLAKMTDAGLA